MAFLVPATAAVLGMGLSILFTRSALAALLAWTYSGTAIARSDPSGVRSRAPLCSSAASSV